MANRYITAKAVTGNRTIPQRLITKCAFRKGYYFKDGLRYNAAMTESGSWVIDGSYTYA